MSTQERLLEALVVAEVSVGVCLCIYVLTYIEDTHEILCSK